MKRWFRAEACVPKPFQLEAIHGGLALERICLADGVGLGKGHPVTTRVLTPEGYRLAGDLLPGESVIGSDGRPTVLTAVYSRGELPVYRVSFNDGSSVLVDGEHLWRVRIGSGKAWHTRSTERLARDVLRPTTGTPKWQIPMLSAPVEFQDQGGRPLDPYLLGTLLGDGSFAHSSVTLTAGDVDVPSEVAFVLPEGVTIRKAKNEGRPASQAAWQFSATKRSSAWSSNPVMRALRDLGLAGKRSFDKFIPRAYLLGPPAVRLAVLQGLVDTDGEVRSEDGHVEFASSSQRLADDVAFIVESFGGVARRSVREKPLYRYKGEVRTGRPSYKVGISMPPAFCPVRSKRDVFRAKSKYLPARRISSIEPEGRAEVVCLSVAAPDHLYATEHCLVTHNTVESMGVMLGAFARGQIRRSVIVCPASLRNQWFREIEEKANPRTLPARVKIANGDKRERLALYRGNWQVLILSYDAVRNDIEAVLRFAPTVGLAIADEASILRTPGKTYDAITSAFGRSRYRLALTATPIENNLADLYHILRWVDRKTFLSRAHFDERYVILKRQFFNVKMRNGHTFTMKQVVPDRYKNLAEVRLKIRPVFIRRTAAEVAVQLPEVTVTRELLDLGPRQREVYERVKERTKSEIGDLEGERMLAPLTGLRQACDSTELVAEGRDGKGMSVKADRLRELLAGEFAGESVIIFSDYERFCDLLARELRAFRPVLYTGPMSDRERAASVDQFVRGYRRVLIATKAGERGHNLQTAGVVVLADLPWNPAAIKQRIGRARRMESKHQVIRVRCLIAADTVEEKLILPKVDLKQQLSLDVVGEDELSGARAPMLQGLRGRDLGDLL